MNTALLRKEVEIAGLPRLEERSTSRQLVMSCPLCHDDKSRLYVSADHGAWICHRCGDKGSLFDFCIEILDESPEDAIELVSRLRRTESARETLPARPRGDTIRPVVSLPEGFTAMTINSVALEYLTMRRVSEELILKHNIGFTIIGPARYRVVIPVVTEGRLCTWVARTWLSPGAGWADPKVLNATNSLAGRALFNYDDNNRGTMWSPTGPEEPYVILTESAFDSMALERRNFWAMATLGAHVTDDQRRLLKRKGVKRVVLMRDGDLAGRSAAKVEAQELRAAFFKVSVANLPDGVDPASATDEQITTALVRMEDFE